jgi:hypothetical protein
VYDPDSGAWTLAAPMTAPRWFHVALGLAEGVVLVAGGHGGAAALDSAEVYDPKTDAWSPAERCGPLLGRATGWQGRPGRRGSTALASVELFHRSSAGRFR